MQCPRCKNEDPSWFYHGSKGWYCRRCIAFKRILVCEEMEIVENREEVREFDLHLDYPLTEKQKEISDQLCILSEDHDVLVNAVCGAGKTEIVMEVIRKTLMSGKKAAVAVARRQVVLELAQRFSKAYPDIHVIPVCQGYTEETEADLIVCTTHQLYRYPHRFDLLVLDEPDAFPYKGDPVLHGIASTSCKGHVIYTTATPDEELMKRVKEHTLIELSLNRRPHGRDLPVPVVQIGPGVVNLVRLNLWMRKKQSQKKQALIFVPTIRQAELMYRAFSLLFCCGLISSRSVDKDETVEKLRKKELMFCFATTILERGITISGVDVCVFDADHGVFDEASLIQMVGRVGRSFACPQGDGYFLCRGKSRTVQQCVQRLVSANEAG